MGKTLAEMTLEELWQLFPIFLTEHSADWANWYREERERLSGLLPSDTICHHVGSTAVDGIMAKPIIDVLIVVSDVEKLVSTASCLQKHGCLVMSTHENRISLNRGYTENGFAERVFHYHLRLSGDTDEIYFRDYLNLHPDVAREYERLKLKLWKKYEHDRDGYTAGKIDFVKKYTERAKRDFTARQT